MEVSTLAGPPQRNPETWAAAQNLQKALFTELFRSAGFADAFSTGEQALDALSDNVLGAIVDDFAAADSSLAEEFYKQLSRHE